MKNKRTNNVGVIIMNQPRVAKQNLYTYIGVYTKFFLAINGENEKEKSTVIYFFFSLSLHILPKKQNK